jgi:hypothetical protein
MTIIDENGGIRGQSMWHYSVEMVIEHESLVQSLVNYRFSP